MNKNKWNTTKEALRNALEVTFEEQFATHGGFDPEIAAKWYDLCISVCKDLIVAFDPLIEVQKPVAQPVVVPEPNSQRAAEIRAQELSTGANYFRSILMHYVSVLHARAKIGPDEMLELGGAIDGVFDPITAQIIALETRVRKLESNAITVADR